MQSNGAGGVLNNVPDTCLERQQDSVLQPVCFSALKGVNDCLLGTGELFVSQDV